MKKILTYAMLACLILTIAAGTGCTKRGLDYRAQEGLVRVALSWDKDYAPESCRFYFYREGDAEPIVCDCPPEGFSGKLPVGAYRVIVMNNDAENVSIRGTEQYETAEIYALPDSKASAECASQPKSVYMAARINEVDRIQVNDRDTVEVSATPMSQVKRVRFRFEIENIAVVTALSGTLSGVSTSLFCSTGVCPQQSAAVNLTAVPASDGSCFTASVTVFDLVASPVTQVGLNMLDLAIQEVDGTVRTLSVDLTETINKILNESGGEIPVEIPIRIELTLIGASITASVVPWDGSGSGSGDL